MGRLNPALGQMFEEVFALGAPISETSRALTAMSGGAIVDAINAFKSGALSNEEFMNAMRAATNTSNLEGFADAAYAGGQFGEAMNAVVALQGAQSKMLDEEMDARGDNTKALVAAKDQLQEFKSFTEQAGTAMLDITMNKLPEMFGEMKKGFELFDQHFKGRYPNLANVLVEGGKALAVKIYSAGKEFLFKGQDGKNLMDNLFDNDPNKPGIQFFKRTSGEISSTANLTQAQKEYFAFGQRLSPIGGNATTALTTDRPVPTTAEALDTVTNINRDAARGNYSDELLNEMKKQVAALNTLVTIGAMTEKNTKNMNNNVANMGGSLV